MSLNNIFFNGIHSAKKTVTAEEKKSLFRSANIMINPG